MGDQMAQNLKFFGGEVNCFICFSGAIVLKIKNDLPERIALSRLIRRAATTPEQRMHPRQQLAQAERLGHVIVRPQLQPQNFIDFLSFGGEHDDGVSLPLARRVLQTSYPGIWGSMRSNRIKSTGADRA